MELLWSGLLEAFTRSLELILGICSWYVLLETINHSSLLLLSTLHAISALIILVRLRFNYTLVHLNNHLELEWDGKRLGRFAASWIYVQPLLSDASLSCSEYVFNIRSVYSTTVLYFIRIFTVIFYFYNCIKTFWWWWKILLNCIFLFSNWGHWYCSVAKMVACTSRWRRLTACWNRRTYRR